MLNRTRLQMAGVALAAGAVVFFALGAGEPQPKASGYQTVFVPSIIPPAAQPVEAETTPDGVKLAADIDKELRRLTSKGLEIVEIIPVTKGIYRWRAEQTVDRGGTNAAASAYGYGYGFGVTSGVLIVARQP